MPEPGKYPVRMTRAFGRFVASRWAEPLGVVLVAALVVAGSVAEAFPAHHYAGLHLRSHPSPAFFALLAVPALLLLWRRSHPVEVYAVSVVAVAGWAASGQVYGAALVMVLVSFYSLAVGRPKWPVVVCGARGVGWAAHSSICGLRWWRPAQRGRSWRPGGAGS
jgi:hypothetical protein